MLELKKKVSEIAGQLEALENKLWMNEQSPAAQRDTDEVMEVCAWEIDRFFRLESATNFDLRKIIDYISVNPSRNVRIFLRKTAESDLPMKGQQ